MFKTFAAASALAAIAFAFAPVAASAKAGGNHNGNQPPVKVDVQTQASQPRIKANLKIRFTCHRTYHKDKLGIYIIGRECTPA